MNYPQPDSRSGRGPRVAALVLAAAVLAACGSGAGGGSSTPPARQQGDASASGVGPGQPVLPVRANPITSTSTVQALVIDSVLVENNFDAAGAAASDHLEMALTNSGSEELRAFEVFYTFTDPATQVSESYYLALPDTFTIPAGETRVAHFDNTGAVDHFPVNDFSLFYTDSNALEVSVQVSAVDSATQTSNVRKDAGGAEQAD
jgi:hypothetical protein